MKIHSPSARAVEFPDLSKEQISAVLNYARNLSEFKVLCSSVCPKLHNPNPSGAAGYEVLLWRDYIPIESPDPVVIAKAPELGAILVTLNGDFADIVTYPPADYQGIISLQLRNHPEIIPQLMKRLTDYLSVHSSMEYYQGKLLSVEVYRIRIRE